MTIVNDDQPIFHPFRLKLFLSGSWDIKRLFSIFLPTPFITIAEQQFWVVVYLLVSMVISQIYIYILLVFVIYLLLDVVRKPG